MIGAVRVRLERLQLFCLSVDFGVRRYHETCFTTWLEVNCRGFRQHGTSTLVLSIHSKARIKI